MTEKLTKAAQQALEAFDAFADADDFPTMYALTQKMNALRDTLTAAQPAQAVEREAWGPYLVDRADGVKGHYAIGRWNPRGYREVWNLHSHRWAAYSDDVMSLEEADSLLRQITIPTARASLPTQPAAQAGIMGMPTSCGKPLCSPDEHHPLCRLHKPAAQATPEPTIDDDDLLGIIAEIRDTVHRLAPGMAEVELLQAVGGPSEVPAYVEAVVKSLTTTPEPVGEPFAWTSMGQIRFTPPTQDHGTYTPLYTHPTPGVPEGVQRNAARWGTIKASKPQLGISWLGVPFVGFEFTGSANKAWADSVKSGLDIDDAMDAAMLAAAQAKGGEHA